MGSRFSTVFSVSTKGDTLMATRTSAPTKSAPSSRLDKAELLEMCRLILLSRRIDDREIQLKRQNKIFFQISGAGHEAVLVAASKVFRPAYDWFYTYYRDRALCLGLGMTATEQLLSAVAAADDPNSGGRQMPSHWGHKDLNIVSASSPTGTQFLQAVGCAEAWLRSSRTPGIATPETPYHGDEVVFCSTGDGTTSQGEFWESMNTACNLKLPVVYLVEDNGYAISTPVEVNTAGGSISKLLVRLPRSLHPGSERLRRPRFLRRAEPRRGLLPPAEGPGPGPRHVIRPYSHSLSDDEVNYRTAAEREADAERDPVTTFPRWLVAQGIASEAEIERIRTGGGGGGRCRHRHRARLAAAGHGHHLRLRLLPRRRPDVGAVRHRGRSAVHRRADHDGGPDQRLPQGRDGARPADRRLRSGRGRREPRGAHR